MNPPLSTIIRLPIDGLSRCLCPLLDSTILPFHRRIRNPTTSAIRRPRISNQAPRASRLYQRRGYYGQASASHGAVRDPVSFASKPDAELKDLPIEELHERLHWAPHEEEDAYKKTTSLVHYLIAERGQTPSLIHYNALIKVNADAQLGSASVVEGLLEEMKAEKINADSVLYHNALQVLAIHPDYVLRARILAEMKERWISLKPSGYDSLILGLLRDHQFEMALSVLHNAQQDSIPISSYVQDIMLYTLLNTAELDTALALLQSRVANHGVSNVSAYVWYYMLSTCASDFHHPGIKYVWQKQVEESYINPSDGICTAALNTAARNHDPVLATDVIRVLANRKARIEAHHYEALLESYIGVGDVKSAMRMLCIMRKAKLEPDGSFTRELVLWLRKPNNEEHLNKAWGILKALKADRQEIPTAAANAVLEAFVSRDRLDEAIKAYKELHSICVDGADTETFNVLFKGCREAESTSPRASKALAMFLAAEMRALGVEASELTYDRLILLCLGLGKGDSGLDDASKKASSKHAKYLQSTEAENHDLEGKEHGRYKATEKEEEDYEDAFRYYEEMKRVGGARGWKPRRGTYTSMVKACGEREPATAWTLIEEMDLLGMPTTQVRAWMQQIGFGHPDVEWGRQVGRRAEADRVGMVAERLDRGKRYFGRRYFGKPYWEEPEKDRERSKARMREFKSRRRA